MTSELEAATPAPSPPAHEPAWLRIVRRRLTGLAYGTVQVVVHDGRVLQIEVTEKTRLSDPNHPHRHAASTNRNR